MISDQPETPFAHTLFTAIHLATDRSPAQQLHSCLLLINHALIANMQSIPAKDPGVVSFAIISHLFTYRPDLVVFIFVVVIAMEYFLYLK